MTDIGLLKKLQTLAQFGVKRIFVTSVHMELIAREIMLHHKGDLVDPLVLPNNSNFRGFIYDGMQVINTGSESEAEANWLNQEEADRVQFQARRERFIAARIH